MSPPLKSLPQSLGLNLLCDILMDAVIWRVYLHPTHLGAGWPKIRLLSPLPLLLRPVA